VVSGDLLGNCHCFIPLGIAFALALAAGLLFGAARPRLATAVALVAITTSATVPVHALLDPPHDASTLYRFDDGAIVTLEGWLIREPERSANQRAYLYVAADRGPRPAGEYRRGRVAARSGAWHGPGDGHERSALSRR
jgi:hypothetical protein